MGQGGSLPLSAGWHHALHKIAYAIPLLPSGTAAMSQPSVQQSPSKYVCSSAPGQAADCQVHGLGRLLWLDPHTCLTTVVQTAHSGFWCFLLLAQQCLQLWPGWPSHRDLGAACQGPGLSSWASGAVAQLPYVPNCKASQLALGGLCRIGSGYLAGSATGSCKPCCTFGCSQHGT